VTDAEVPSLGDDPGDLSAAAAKIHHEPFNVREAARNTQRADPPFLFLAQHVDGKSSAQIDGADELGRVDGGASRLSGEDVDLIVGNTKVGTDDLEAIQRGNDLFNHVLRDGDLLSSFPVKLSVIE